MIESMLKEITMFSKLDNDELKKIIEISQLKIVNENNILFYEKEQAKSFYILLEGALKLYKMRSKSQEVILHHFFTPSLIAEVATLEDMRFPATCVSIQNRSLVLVLEKEKFKNIIMNNPYFSLHIVKSLSQKIKTLESTINRNLVFDAITKVCSLLKEEPNIFLKHKNIQIASLLNMAPETLSRILKKLKTMKIVDKNNQLVNQEKLQLFLEF